MDPKEANPLAVFGVTAMKRVNEATPLKEPEGTNVQQTTFNMINCFIGAGILTVPYAFRVAGYGAVFGLALVAVLNWYTSLLLGRSLQKAAELDPDVPRSQWDMSTLGRVAFGASGERFISLLFALELWFALETFLVLTGLNVQLLFGISASKAIVGAGILGVLSLTLPMKLVSYVSGLSVWCMIGGLAALIVCGCGSRFDRVPGAGPAPPLHHVQLNPWSMTSAIAIFLYCFSGLPCLPNIRASMQKPREYDAAAHAAHIFAFFYYALVGMLGYFFYAEGTKESFTKNLTPVHGQGHLHIYAVVVTLSAALFAGKLQAGFPLYATPILNTLGFGARSDKNFVEVWAARVVFGTMSIAFAVFAQDALDAVAELMGAFLTNSTSLVFPTLAYVAISRKCGETLTFGQKFRAGSLVLFGVVFGVYGTTTACFRLWAERVSVF